jgi:hypothetical protein
MRRTSLLWRLVVVPGACTADGGTVDKDMFQSAMILCIRQLAFADKSDAVNLQLQQVHMR